MTKFAWALVLASCALAQQQDGFVQFDWEKLSSKAAEKTDVNLKGPMLEMASKFLSDKGDEAEIRKLIQGLKGIYVKTFEFDKDGQFSDADVSSIRGQLRGPGWSTLMDMKDHSEVMGIYVRSEGNRNTGLAVLAVEPRELTLVQIDGPIDPATLSSLGGKLGIPRMNLGPIVPKPKATPPPAKKKN